MSIPKKHHFLPEFYQQKWCGPDRKIARFSKPVPSKLVSDRKFPSETGFENFLYSLGNLPVEEAQVIESEFFSKVDDRAAVALNQLHTNGQITENLVEGWWQFVATLMTRMPSDVRKHRELRKRLADAVLPILEDVKHLPEFKSRADEIESASLSIKEAQINEAMRGLMGFMSDRKLIDRLQALHWKVVSTIGVPFELLTSDRPVEFRKSVAGSGFQIRLPLGPNLVFIASENYRELLSIVNGNNNHLVREMNAAIVGSAEQYVIGRTESQKYFIESNMGKKPRESLIDLYSQAFDAHLPSIEEGLRLGMMEKFEAL